MLNRMALIAAAAAGGTLLASPSNAAVSHSLRQPVSQTRPAAALAKAALAPGQSARITALDFISPAKGWAVGTVTAKNGLTQSETVYGTSDGGKTWTALDTWNKKRPMPTPAQATTGIPLISRLGFQNAQLGHAVIFLGGGAGQAAYGVLATNDGGLKWTLKTHKILLGSNGPVGISFPGTGSIGWFANGSFAGAFSLLAKTTNNGASWSEWSKIKAPQPSPSALALRFTSRVSGYMVVASSGYQKVSPSLLSLTTANGGKNWQSKPLATKGLPDLISGMSFAKPGVGWLIGADINRPYKLYRFSHNAWVSLPTPGARENELPVLDLVTGKTAYLAQMETGSKVALWKTVDQGQHWTRTSFPLP